LAATLAAAFYDDPPFVWLMPDAGRRDKRLRLFFQLELRLVGLGQGNIWTGDGLAGALIATPPGKWRAATSVTGRDAITYVRAFGMRLSRAASLIAAMEASHFQAPHHYIPFIGVAPLAQGAGLGTRLLEPVLARCDQERLPAYLEATTERNAALYERLGFRQTGEFHYGASEPPRQMLRPPVGG
jgi:ribosomal protein S18 acetylase RimI-like enzyme